MFETTYTPFQTKPEPAGEADARFPTRPSIRTAKTLELEIIGTEVENAIRTTASG